MTFTDIFEAESSFLEHRVKNRVEKEEKLETGSSNSSVSLILYPTYICICVCIWVCVYMWTYSQLSYSHVLMKSSWWLWEISSSLQQASFVTWTSVTLSRFRKLHQSGSSIYWQISKSEWTRLARSISSNLKSLINNWYFCPGLCAM